MTTTPPPGDGAPPDADAHARTWALLPWLVNGRADAQARAQALAHLAQCDDCRAEWQAQQALAGAVQASEPQAQALPGPEAGLQRLLGRLDSLPQVQPEAPSSPLPTSRVPAPLAHRPRAGWLLPALAAAVVVQAVGLAVLGVQLLDGGRDTFSPLSQAAPPAAAAARWRVLPDGAMTLAQWQALLQAHDLVVVDGPNGAGAYGLAPRQPSAAAAGDILARLRAAPGVRLAEPLGRP